MKLVVWALAWLAGIAAVALWGAPWWMAGAWVALALPAVLTRMGGKAALVAAVAIVFALAGGWRFDRWENRPPPDLARYVGRHVTIEGVVDTEADPGRTTAAFRVRVERIRANEGWRKTDGGVRASLNQYANYLPGTRLRLEGTVEEPPVFAEFDYRAYLARQDVVAMMLRPEVEVLSEPGAGNVTAQVARLRLALDRGIQRSLPEPEASLGAGIAFGRDSTLPDDVYEDFRATGLAHLVAVSGSNVSLVAALVFIVAVPIMGRKWAMLPAAGLIAFYVVSAGMSASVVRAAIMAAVFLFGAALGRQQSALPALGAAAVLMTAWSPSAAADAGFQLSVAATAGLIVFGPWLHYALRAGARRAGLGPFIPGLVLLAGALSLAATVATLPLVWVTFGRVSLVGPLANLVAEPLFVVAFTLSALTAVAGAAWPEAGWAAGLAAYYPLAFLTWFAETLGGVPLASAAVPGRSSTVAAAAYVAMGAVAWPAYRHLAPAEPGGGRHRHTGMVRGIALAAVAGGMAIAALLTGVGREGGPGEMEITVLDVGQGDAILVTTPHGRRYLVDGGPSGIELARELGAVLPHWERRIEGAFLTHPQEDHAGGLPAIFARYRVGAAFDTGAENPTGTLREYGARAPGRKVLGQGDSFEADGVRFEVLWPPRGLSTDDLNGSSLVLRITYGETAALLTGDLGVEGQQALLATTQLSADILKVPHHGSKTTSAAFLFAVEPSVAVIPVGAGNRYGHPAQETLDALAGAVVLRTDQHGRVTVASDGKRITVRTER